jgi:hypothetical protein
MVRISGQFLAAACVLALGLSSTANAQTVQVSSRESLIGFTGGVSIDPEQAFAGVFWQTAQIGGRFHLRPGIEGGFGSDLKLATINVDFIARFPLGASGWDLIQGGGPAIVIARNDVLRTDRTDVGAGGSYVIGFAHDSGFLGEFRIGGGGNVPNLKLTAGYAIGF